MFVFYHQKWNSYIEFYQFSDPLSPSPRFLKFLEEGLRVPKINKIQNMNSNFGDRIQTEQFI